MNLVYGEMEPQDRCISKAEARNTLLYIIKQESPEVLQALYDNVYPVYEQLRKEIEKATKTQEAYIARCNKYKDKDGRYVVLAWNDRDIEACYRYNVQDDFYPDLMPLKQALDKWTERYNIQYHWMFKTGLATIRLWYNISEFKNQKDWQYIGTVFWKLQLPIFEFPEHFEWDIAFETEGRFKEKIRKRLDEYLDKYITKCKKIAQDRGYIEGLKKRNRSGDPFYHFKWYIMHHIQGIGIKDIADEVAERDPDGGITEDAIKKAIVEIEKLIAD